MGQRRKPRIEGLTTSDLSGLPIATLAGHARERYNNLRTILTLFYPLRHLGWLPDQPVTHAGAAWQKARGTRKDATEAAHTLPRRLLIGGRSLTEWLAGRDDLLLAAIASLEGTVTTLPAAVNRADSAWEGAGLATAFADAAALALASGACDPATAETHLSEAWTQFHRAAGNALAHARASALPDPSAQILAFYAERHDIDGREPPSQMGYYWSLLATDGS